MECGTMNTDRIRGHELPLGKLREAIIKEGGVVGPVVAVLQRHRHQTAAVPLRAGYQRTARRLGVPCFQADAAFHLTQEAVVVLHGALADGDTAAGADAPERGVFHRRGGQQQIGNRPGQSSATCWPTLTV